MWLYIVAVYAWGISYHIQLTRSPHKFVAIFNTTGSCIITCRFVFHQTLFACVYMWPCVTSCHLNGLSLRSSDYAITWQCQHWSRMINLDRWRARYFLALTSTSGRLLTCVSCSYQRGSFRSIFAFLRSVRVAINSRDATNQGSFNLPLFSNVCWHSPSVI
jgi:hypothetical protein